ncbi:phospholipid phosphatase 3-like isoform X2 [Homalodisca vitripennis]|uniref:phospholipid phosphatase 3-like isoform X2 n=1 Tax=Homalodisca vitripennis TaxID=197043 RepID=UPI001EEAEDD8|nr:phospholipid phosphatase 3-like isoform X2 [Homalodisca vitripennis]
MITPKSSDMNAEFDSRNNYPLYPVIEDIHDYPKSMDTDERTNHRTIPMRTAACRRHDDPEPPSTEKDSNGRSANSLSSCVESVMGIFCTFVLGLVVLLTAIFGHPYQRGFFCDDDSIRYPLVSETITTPQVAIASFVIPIPIIFAVECYRLLETSTPRDSWHSVSRAVLRSFLEVYGIFVFGSGLSQVTVDMGKLTVGRLRPHFLTVCQPDNLDQLCPSDTAHTYITDIHCTGSPGTVEEGRLSFPSGHAAVSFYAAIYVVVFLRHRLYWRAVRFPNYLLQAGLVFAAWFTSLSRVQNFMHHPTDVLAGAIIGTFWAIVVTRFVINMKVDSEQMSKDDLRSLRATPTHLQGPNSV